MKSERKIFELQGIRTSISDSPESHNSDISNEDSIREEREGLLPLEDRIKDILGIVDRDVHRDNDMLFFVMYDIENNKVRRMVSKYLIKQGCHRIQKSIFLANLSVNQYRDIKDSLAQIQSLYDNEDSIIVIPVPSENIKSMNVIGKSINLDIIARTRNTLFV